MSRLAGPGMVAAIVAILFAVSFMGAAPHAARGPQVRWLGYVSFGTEGRNVDPHFAPWASRFQTVVDSSVAIGLRDDGVVVWRSIKDPRVGSE